MIRVEVKNCNMILREKRQNDQLYHQVKLINMNIRQIIEQAKSTYSPLGKAFEKQTKAIEVQGEKQIKALENRVEKKNLNTDKKSIASLFSKDYLNEEATYELNKTTAMEKKPDRNDLMYKSSNNKKDKTFDFQKSKQQGLLEETFITIIYH